MVHGCVASVWYEPSRRRLYVRTNEKWMAEACVRVLCKDTKPFGRTSECVRVSVCVCPRVYYTNAMPVVLRTAGASKRQAVLWLWHRRRTKMYGERTNEQTNERTEPFRTNWFVCSLPRSTFVVCMDWFFSTWLTGDCTHTYVSRQRTCTREKMTAMVLVWAHETNEFYGDLWLTEPFVRRRWILFENNFWREKPINY